MNPVSYGVSLPSPGDGLDPVAFAVGAEHHGLDFVSVSDHPAIGDPTHEPWTLLSWIAASTSRIRVATKVLGVPFRWPAMIAKMAETLDRLSDGRLILGLGGGYDDREMHSLGVGTRTPGEKVDGLEETIRILRGLWSEAEFSFQGRRYEIDRAQMQPKPTHPIPIWLGTYGPRALALTGRLADGWVPSLGFLDPANIPPLRARIVDAARQAGRAPEQITFVCNLAIQLDGARPAEPSIVSGSTAQILERLTEIRELGFTSMNFNLSGGSRSEQLQRLAEEILPSLRA